MYLAIADDPGLDKMLSVLYLVLRKKGCSQEEKEWMAKPPAAKQVGANTHTQPSSHMHISIHPHTHALSHTCTHTHTLTLIPILHH